MLGLAIGKVAEYTKKQNDSLNAVSQLQADVDTATRSGKDDVIREAQKALTREQTKLGLYRTFLDFWKEAVKSILGQLKSIQEIAFSGR